MAVTSFAALLDAVPMVPTTAFRDAFYPATTTLNTRVHNLETGNIEQWDGTTWNVIFEGAGSSTGGILYAGAGAPNGAQVGHPGDGYVQLVSSTVTLFWLKQSGTGTTAGWQALAATGTGSPDGVLAAPIGVPYTQTDGAFGSVQWVKNSGTGTTGWRLTQTTLGLYNVRDYGATGNGSTDDTLAIQAALAAIPTTPTLAHGGFVYFPPGNYRISSTLTLAKQGVTFGGLQLGGTTANGVVTLEALPGFSGSLLLVQVGAGDKGVKVQHLRLDGNNEALATNALEFHANTLARCYVEDVVTANTPTGFLFNDNCQSIICRECYVNTGHQVGLNITTNSRSLGFRDCVFGGSVVAAYCGPDSASSAETCTLLNFVGCEFYAQGATPTAVCLVRNTESCVFTGTWMEQAGANTLTSLLQLGTATATAVRPSFLGRFVGNSKATYGCEIVQASRPFLNGFAQNVGTSAVKLTSTTSRAVLIGLDPDVRTGAALVLGTANGLLHFQGYGGSARTVTSSTAALISDRTLLVDATSGGVTVTLLAVSGSPDQILTVKKIDSSANTVTVKGNGADLIDAANTFVLRQQYEQTTVHNDGTQWWRIGDTGFDTSGFLTAQGFKALAAVGKLIPGATSFSLRNTADSADNFLLTDAGVGTFRAAVSGVTASAADNSTKFATTAYVDRTPGGGTVTSAAPTGTTSATAVMMGLCNGTSIVTPAKSGRVLFTVSGQMANSTAGDGVTVDLRTSTGTGPANGAAVTGTLRGIAQTATSVSAAQRSGFTISVLVTGLTLAQAYWADVSVLAITAGTATVTGVTLTALEYD